MNVTHFYSTLHIFLQTLDTLTETPHITSFTASLPPISIYVILKMAPNVSLAGVMGYKHSLRTFFPNQCLY